MRKNYFAKLVRDMKNVYHIENGLNKLSDERVNPTYKTVQVGMLVLLGFLLRIKNFNKLNLMIKNNEFSKLFPKGTKLPQVDAIRDTLKAIDIKGVKPVNQHIIKKAIDNAVMSTVGNGPKLVVGFEMYRPGQDSSSKDEGELKVAKRLLTSIVRVHKKLIDIVVYESIFTMPNVQEPLRFVKYTMRYPNKKRSQIMIVTTCIDMSLKTLFKIIRARWVLKIQFLTILKKNVA